MALRVHPVIKGAVILFSAYGDFNAFPRRLREGCQRTGVKLIDVPNGRKDAADKAILVDMFLFALDNPPPSSIMLISGDVDFAPALHILGQRGYTAAGVLAQIEKGNKKKQGIQWNKAEEEKFKAKVVEAYEREGSPYYSTARLWDDGIIDPADTRKVIGLCISSSLNRAVQETKYGVFRM